MPQYCVSLTADGSPTLQFGRIEDQNETMHNREGAFSESLYIYWEAMRTCVTKQWPLHFMSVGLGLGYNELILSGYMVSLQVAPNEKVKIQSFESEAWLTNNFVQWLSEEKSEFPDLTAAYEIVLQKVSEHFYVNPEAIRQWLLEMKKGEHWLPGGALTGSTRPPHLFNCILYDAFSSKTSPELWNEEFLIRFFEDFADKHCIFSTYAATGSLKRSLLKSGFTVEMRSGFGGKRNSTSGILGA
ncbi:MAG: hypothetical protein H6626_14460 [Pseudobdellovibrionaceae bacterium]|nr:MAG: hypothetical protein H6626_14460 [Pseudobdellovibrionaceae bacterium]